MNTDENRLRIARQLLADADIREKEFRAWKLHAIEERSFFKIHLLLGCAGSTARIWFNNVDDLICQVEAQERAQGPVRAGITIERNGEVLTVADPCLKALGF